MTTIECRYTGDLHCEAVHAQSGKLLQTDAPTDHDGLGESFSPTDLLATSLGTCVLTIMGITAKRRQWNISGATALVEKHMTQQGPRQIDCLRVYVSCPTNAATTSNDCFSAWRKTAP